MVTRSKHADLEEMYSIESAKQRFPDLKWQIEELPEEKRFLRKNDPARIARATVGSDVSGRIITLVAMENVGQAGAWLNEGGLVISIEGGLMTPQGTHTTREMPMSFQPSDAQAIRADWWLGAILYRATT